MRACRYWEVRWGNLRGHVPSSPVPNFDCMQSAMLVGPQSCLDPVHKRSEERDKLREEIRMASTSLKGAAILMTLAVATALLNSPTVRAHSPGVDPAAVEILERMTDYISNLQQFTVHTDNTLEDYLDSGQRVDISIAARVAVRRPNKIHAERLGDLISQDFYYDGETLTLYNPSDGVYATVPAPGTIEELLDYTRESLGLVIPVSDLVYRNVLAIMMQDVTAAVVVGKTVIDGVICDHLAFSRPGVDFQVWVAEGDRPVPCKYVITDTSTPAYVSTVTVMSDWNLAPALSDASFNFAAPDGSRRIEFMILDENSDFSR
jgi:hypothetical protein